MAEKNPFAESDGSPKKGQEFEFLKFAEEQYKKDLEKLTPEERKKELESMERMEKKMSS